MAKGQEYKSFPTSIRQVYTPYQFKTGLRLDYPSPFGDGLNTLDGFGPYSPIYSTFSEVLVDPNIPTDPFETTDPASPVFLVDLTEIRVNPSADFTKVAKPVSLLYNDVVAEVNVNTLVALPYFPLTPNRDYAFVITTGLEAATVGNTERRCVSAAPLTHCLKSDSEVDPLYDDSRRGLAPLWPYLESYGIGKDEVSLVLHYRTQSVEDELVQIRRSIEKNPAPVGRIDPDRIWDVSTDTGELSPEFRAALDPLFGDNADIDVNLDDYDFDTIGKAAYGYFESVEYRHPDPDIGFWIPDNATGEIQPQDVVTLEWFLLLPKVDPDRGIVPPFKTMIFQHALGVCKETSIAMANALTERGIAVIGIDVANFGSRTPPDDEGNPWDGACQQDPLNFLELDNPLRARDNFRQTVVDQMQFTKMLKSLNVDLVGPEGVPDGENDLDTTRLGYSSQSLGSIIGGTFVALEPDIGAAVLNVGGGGIYNIALSFFGGGDTTGGPSAFQDLPVFLLDFFLVAQTMLERADPIHYARGYWRSPFQIREAPNPPTNVLMQMAVNDDIVGNFSTETLLRAAGGAQIPQVFYDAPHIGTMQTPLVGNVADGTATVALSQFDPAEHSFLLTTDDPEAFYRGQQQAAIFIDTYLNEGIATAIDAWDDAELAAHAP